MEISIVILSCVILDLNPEMPVFIRLIMICNLNGFRQIKYIHTTDPSNSDNPDGDGGGWVCAKCVRVCAYVRVCVMCLPYTMLLFDPG